MAPPRQSDSKLERGMVEDHIADQLERIRYELSDLHELADANELDVDLAAAIHAAAQDIYRGEQVLRR
jgi:hypothetical protein